jgi:uridine kinase
MPPPSSAERAAVIGTVAGWIAELGPGRLRVAVDGLTGAGKTSFGHELAAALRALGRPTMRASMDDFKHPWRHAREHGYDRVSGEGYYRNAPDFSSARELLLRPAGPGGSGDVVLCAHDPLTGEDHRDMSVHAPVDAVLIVDSAFAFRREYNEFWDYRIWLDVDADMALARGFPGTPRWKGWKRLSGATIATALPNGFTSLRSTPCPWPTSSLTTATLHAPTSCGSGTPDQASRPYRIRAGM